MPDPAAPRPPRRRLKRTLILLAAFLAFSYVSAYVALSRNGVRAYAPFRVPGFWYLSHSLLKDGSPTAWRIERALQVFFAPANCVDRTLCGGPSPASEPLWGIRER